MTAPNNNFRKRYYEHIAGRVIKTNATINSGDMMYWVPGSGYYDVCDTDGKAAAFAGVSNDTDPVTSLNERTPETRGIRINRHGIFEFFTTSGETYVEGTPVHVGADAQTVSTAGANIVGYAIMPDMITSIAGASGVKVPVAIQPIFPSLDI